MGKLTAPRPVSDGPEPIRPLHERARLRAAHPSVVAALKVSPPFARAGRATRDALAAASSRVEFVADAHLFEQGEPIAWLGLLLRGRVRVERSVRSARARGGAPPGPLGVRAVPFAFRGAFEVLDEGCFGAPGVHATTAIAIESGEILRVPLDALREAEEADAALGVATLALLAARQREAEDRIESLLFRHVEGRLVEFLLKSSERWGVPSPRGTLISVPLTHLEIAQAIGSTRETVTLTLGALRREGLLEVAGRRLVVRDKATLGARA